MNEFTFQFVPQVKIFIYSFHIKELGWYILETCYFALLLNVSVKYEATTSS